MLGSETHFGWSLDTYLLAAITNAANTKVKGKKLTPTQRVEPPKVIKKKTTRPVDFSKPVRNIRLSSLIPQQA